MTSTLMLIQRCVMDYLAIPSLQPKKLGCEGHRSDVLLDLSGLTREERAMIQGSIGNERDFDRVAEALIIQHPRIHLSLRIGDTWPET